MNSEWIENGSESEGSNETEAELSMKKRRHTPEQMARKRQCVTIVLLYGSTALQTAVGKLSASETMCGPASATQLKPNSSSLAELTGILEWAQSRTPFSPTRAMPTSSMTMGIGEWLPMRG
jgi:hypothetical protein